MFLLSENASVLGKLFGSLINLIFDGVYSISPTYSLFFTIIIFTLLTKLILLPLAIKQQKSMLQTQAMQPELKALQDKYKNKNDEASQQKMATEMQELYKKHNANPFVSCLLPFIQLPIVIALFDVFKSVHIYINKLGIIYTSILEKITTVPNYETILKNLGAAKKLADADYTVVDNIKHLFTTLNEADWSALLGDIASHVDTNAISSLLEQKMQIETVFNVNLINSPSFSNISIILPLLTVLITYISMKSTTSNNDGLDEQSKQMMKNMSNMMKFLIISIFLTSLSLPAAISIYWSLSTLIQMIQQKLLKKYVKLEDK